MHEGFLNSGLGEKGEHSKTGEGVARHPPLESGYTQKGKNTGEVYWGKKKKEDDRRSVGLERGRRSRGSARACKQLMAGPNGWGRGKKRGDNA